MTTQAALDARAPAPWRTRWQALRDRLLTDPRIRRRALAFAPTRWIARRRARALFDIVAGFVYSQTLLACVQLRLFDRLAAGPDTVDVLAERCGLAPERLQRLLDAAVALTLLERRGPGRYGLGPLGAAMVDNPALDAMVEHHAALYADLRDPLALLQGRAGALAAYWPYDGDAPQTLPDGRVADYSALMSASQPLVADEILDAYPVQDHRRLLDVGGGEGLFLAAAAARAPALQLMLFDLPPVAQRAQARLDGLGLGPRVRTFGGNFLRDALPRGADLISLVRVIHDQDDDDAQDLLRAAHDALPPGGVLLLAEPMAGTAGAETMGDAYFGLYLLAMGQGRPRSAAELAQRLRAAGFALVQQRPTRLPLQTGLLIARRKL